MIKLTILKAELIDNKIEEEKYKSYSIIKKNIENAGFNNGIYSW